MSRRLTSDEWQMVSRAIANELDALYAKQKNGGPNVKYLATRNISWLESARAKLQGVDTPEETAARKLTRLQKHGIRLAEAVIEEGKS